MNKETIYIESTDDITDILSHLKSTDKKIIALVPPKKPGGILSSSVNMKLIARTARAEKKVVVLITTDDPLTKLAMNANLPVAPSLKSRPVIPDNFNQDEPEKPDSSSAPEKAPTPSSKAAAADFVSEPEPSKIFEKPEKTAEAKDNKANSDDEEDIDPEEILDEDDEKDVREDKNNDEDEEDDDEGDKKSSKKSKKSKKADKKDKSKQSKLKMWIIFGSVAGVLVIGFLIWALKFAPAVDVAVSVRTSSGNFSQPVSFTKDASSEDVSSGVFYAHEEKLEKSQSVKFSATGKEDRGEKASGKIGVQAYVKVGSSVAVSGGSIFSYKDLEYASTAPLTLMGPTGKSASALKAACSNYNEEFDPDVDSCLVSGTLTVQAVAAGEKYNLGDLGAEGWESSVGGVVVSGSDPITGGTSKLVTVVQQSDVTQAMEKISAESSSENKEELFSKLSETSMAVEASFKINASEPAVSPAVGQEVPDGVTPEITSKTVYTVLTIDKVRVEEFINSRANIGENDRLYSIGSPFIEYFTEVENGTFTGKLKTTYRSGPKISETEVLEKVQGEKIGRIEPILKDAFSGVSSVNVEKSYFWVNSVPSDPNKIKIKIEIEE